MFVGKGVWGWERRRKRQSIARSSSTGQLQADDSQACWDVFDQLNEKLTTIFGYGNGGVVEE